MSLLVEAVTFPEHAPQTGAEALIAQADHFATLYGVSTELTEPTYDLLSRLESADHRTAAESIQALPLALAAGEEVLGFYRDAQVNFSGIWATALLHDVGKSALRPGLIAKSNLGQSWDDADRKEMERHTQAGGDMVRQAGLPEPVARAVEEHHNKQLSHANYGTDSQLNDEERIIRDCVAVADFADAMMTRLNSRNRDMSLADKKQAILQDISLVFDDYTEGEQLARAVYARLMAQLDTQA